MKARLIHPVKCKILKYKAGVTYDEDFKEETTDDIWDSANPIEVSAQVKIFNWTKEIAVLSGYDENSRGYLLCRIEDVKGIVKLNYKIIEIGSMEVEYYVTELRPATVYDDFNFIKLVFENEAKGRAA